MKRLIQWSVEHHWMVLAASVLLLLSGLWTARSMPVDVFPDLTAPTVTILTEGHGMAPDEMESLASTLPHATLRLCDQGDHSLVASKKLDPMGRLLEEAMDFAVSWMNARAVT